MHPDVDPLSANVLGTIGVAQIFSQDHLGTFVLDKNGKLLTKLWFHMYD